MTSEPVRVALVTGSGGPDIVTADGVRFAEAIDVPLVAALERRGISVQRPVWHDPVVAWDAFDLALVRTTWDYPPRRDEFVAWAQQVAAVTRLYNPPDVLRWNTHKSYLLELEDRGAPVVPTAWLGQGDRIDLGALLADRGWSRAVVKPGVGSSAEGLLLVAVDPTGHLDDPAPAADVSQGQAHLDRLLDRGDALVQPFLHGIEVTGELSVVVIDGQVSHAVRKLPRTGDFRVQEEFGGRAHPALVDTEVAALARWAVESTGADLLVARVDLVEDGSGTPQLVELEATEPDLFLGVAPGAADRLAEAIVERTRT